MPFLHFFDFIATFGHFYTFLNFSPFQVLFVLFGKYLCTFWPFFLFSGNFRHFLAHLGTSGHLLGLFGFVGTFCHFLVPFGTCYRLVGPFWYFFCAGGGRWGDRGRDQSHYSQKHYPMQKDLGQKNHLMPHTHSHRHCDLETESAQKANSMKIKKKKKIW